MPKATGDPALFGSRESREQHLPVAVDYLVFDQLDRPGRHGPAGELQGLGLRDALVEITIELHEQGRSSHVIDIPEAADRTAGPGL